MICTFRSTVADGRSTVAGARDVGSEQRVAEKEDHTYRDRDENGSEVRVMTLNII